MENGKERRRTNGRKEIEEETQVRKKEIIKQRIAKKKEKG